MSPENLSFDDDDDRPTTPIVYLAREPRPLVMLALEESIPHGGDEAATREAHAADAPAGFDESEERFFASEELVAEMWACARERERAEARARRAHEARYAARRARAQMVARLGIAAAVAFSAAVLIFG